jgi:predicted TIM-barrel fold metal-dependent hydrolase
MTPSEYFKRNVWVGASALFDEGSTAVRHEIGINNVMWGTDYPHPEGSWPNTHDKMVRYLKGVPEPELKLMLSSNAIECYNLDETELNKIAARIGPLKSVFA